MKLNVKNLPLFKKILMFSFMITTVVVVSTMGTSFYLQSKQLKTQMADKVEGVAGIWSSTLDPEDIRKADESRDKSNPSIRRLEKLLTMVGDKSASFLGAYVMLPEEYPNQKVYILSASDIYRDYSFDSLMYYDAGEEFIRAYRKTRENKTITSTDVFTDQYGSWISSFAPITDNSGNVVAILGIDAKASIIKENQMEILLLLLLEMAAILAVVYVILHWGLRKVMKPVDDLFFGIKEISSGNFTVKLPVHDQSELSLLSEKFNEMASQLSQLFERVSAASKQLGQTSLEDKESLLLEEAINTMEDIFERTKLQQELQRAEKMNAIGQLAASVAHEIRNPMTVVKGFLQIFLSKEMSEEDHMYLKLMIEELNRAETIINDYLSLAKPDIGKLVIIDGSEMTEQVMDLMSSYAMMSKNISMHTEIKNQVKIRGNKSELKQVLINILKNGIEAMGDGGKLSMTLEKQGDFGVFVIKDTGIGMTAEELSRLGTAFYSLKERGTGMGLMVCYQIVERMKGQIKVSSKKGEGTTFEIMVPIFTESPE
ncbi:ATP-binding protein [Mesobacillus selenatarsenatis]|uniref:histidine kinase n=1 Tax=Mesobacillus selenatarsenatis (strain DSM 18680 / JCM 14380 / FERM P-15431 / SF-1) TaxID=1321606 RepID=A0A0A8X8C0_MESS1|nr:ATP-binding protein [Mesobacillus selenatarsenatis]GAM15282.1 sporulation kinase B homolog 1 [Mesobacillus selenatarsenatis SF-1]